MLPVDRYIPLHVAMAEWSFKPADLNRLLESCREYFDKNYWPNLPIEIELSKTDNYFMSQLNFDGLPYIVKFNFMYLTDTCSKSEKEKIYVHLRGLWNHLINAGICFKPHWGKINFMDYNFVRENFKLDQFQKFIRPAFLNDYLAERLIPPSWAVLKRLTPTSDFRLGVTDDRLKFLGLTSFKDFGIIARC